MVAMLLLVPALAATAEARIRTFCGFVSRDCGRHLQPRCTSGAPCDPGFHQYSGSPFPITIDCLFPLSDVTAPSRWRRSIRREAHHADGGGDAAAIGVAVGVRLVAAKDQGVAR